MQEVTRNYCRERGAVQKRVYGNVLRLATLYEMSGGGGGGDAKYLTILH